MSDLCPVAVAQDSSEDEYQPETAVESHLLLLKQKKYCDVTFTFPNLPDRIEAHEFCLKARSPVFAKIFRMRKSGNVQSNEIEISESTPEIFHQFLEFIYADKLEVNIAGALELIQLSQKYKVHPLTKKCEGLLKTDVIPVMDSVKVFETARRYGRRDLMDRAGPIMIKSFNVLARTDLLANAEEETFVYLLENDDLAVQDVVLFQLILYWGRNQVGSAADNGLLKDKLKNLISKIRYTNMTPDEFTKVVVPAGLLSAEKIVSVYSYFCGDEITRRGLQTKFNITHRKVGNRETVAKIVKFFIDPMDEETFPAFSKQSISFIADRALYGKLQPDYSNRKTVITVIHFCWPDLFWYYKEHHVLNFDVSVVEYSGPAKEGNSTIKFQMKLLSCKPDHWDKVSLEPPVELISGRTYSLIVENHSTSDFGRCHRSDLLVYVGRRLTNIHREANVDVEDVRLTLKDIERKADLYAQGHDYYPSYYEFALIREIEIKLV